MNTEIYQQFRAGWLNNNLYAETIALCERNNISIPKPNSLLPSNPWGDWHWHLQNRLTNKNLEDFLYLFPNYQKQEAGLKKYLTEFDLSILPLNLFLPNGVNKFLPRLGLKPVADPYGVQQEQSVITRVENNKKYYLTTHKKDYATFLPILGSGAGRVYCPMGCAGCYRGEQTRFGQPLCLRKKDGGREQIWLPDPITQTKWLVEEWNSHYPKVYDILFSGGEPMMLDNNTWQKILEELKKAKYIRTFRICTGALFLGLPFRFDDEFIKMLKDFRAETGIQLKISAHVAHPEHITPEAIMFGRKIFNAGIEILPQCPLEPGVNFWLDDLEKTANTLARLDRLLATALGTRTYKWLFDMQEGIPLLPALEIWRRVHDRHQEESDICRPTSFAIFLPRSEGNLNLSFHSLWAIQMQIDEQNKKVKYKIPHASKVWVEYEEKLIKGINDDPLILEKLKNFD
jgi:hypothetical protein